jgi:5-methylcytosine-specific restriction endonuclease McrA
VQAEQRVVHYRGKTYPTFNPIKVFLTVHHIGIDKPDGTPGSPHDKMDCRDENLVALCQRCHLLADLKGHIENAKRTRQRKAEEARRAAGQLEMF